MDQLKFMADQGFTALEDNGRRNRPVAEQESIARAMQKLGLEMSVFVATAGFNDVTFASDKPEARAAISKDTRDAVEVARRVGARWCTVVPGRYDLRLAWDYQTVLVIEDLKRCAEIRECVGLVMVLEPLNTVRDHPGMFLTRIPQAYLICRAVGSLSCKILFDIYYQQITEGDLIPNIDRAWAEIAYSSRGRSIRAAKSRPQARSTTATASNTFMPRATHHRHETQRVSPRQRGRTSGDHGLRGEQSPLTTNTV